MTFGYHTSDQVKPLFVRIDLSFPIVVAYDEKGGFGIIGCEKVEEGASVLAWAIIKGHSKGPLSEAMFDAFGIGHLANKWSYIRGSVCTGWDYVAVTSTKRLLAFPRDLAVVGGVPLSMSEPCISDCRRCTDAVTRVGTTKIIGTLFIAKG